MRPPINRSLNAQAQCKHSWSELLERFGLLCPMFRAAAHALATLDCLQSLAAGASAPNCCRPAILDDDSPALIQPPRGGASGATVSPGEAQADTPMADAGPEGGPAAEAAAAGGCAEGGPGEALIDVTAGRAPLLDEVLPQGAVPNDVTLRGSGLRAMCISGPNMGGKSSYMCQVRHADVCTVRCCPIHPQRGVCRDISSTWLGRGSYMA